MELLFEQVGEGIHEGEENILFAGEVEIERSLGCIRLADDVIHFGVVIALAGKDRYGGFENPLAGFVGWVGGIWFHR